MVYGNNYGNTLNNYQTYPAVRNIPLPDVSGSMQGPLNTNIILVQGETGAKSFLIAPNNEVVLFDSENPVFYKKAMTPQGISFRRFRYEEITDEPQNVSPIMSDTTTRPEIDTSKLVTWDALEDTLPAMVLNAIKQVSAQDKEGGKSNGKPDHTRTDQRTERRNTGSV